MDTEKIGKALLVTLKFLGLVALGLVIFVVVLVLINVVASYVFNYVPFIANIDNKGTLGDAINGYTVPAFSLLTAFLLWYSFKAQIRANEAFTQQALMENYSSTFIEVKRDFDNLNLRYTATFKDDRKEIIEKIGLAAVRKFNILFTGMFREKTGHPLMKNFVYTCKELAALIGEIDSSILPDDRKRYLLMRINRFYVAKMQGSINDLQMKLLPNNASNDRPFNDYYKEGMSELGTAVLNTIGKYLS